MSNKVPCKQCGTMVLMDTAERNNGLCMPCKNGYRNSIDKNKSKIFNSQRQFVISLIVIIPSFIVIVYFVFAVSSSEHCPDMQKYYAKADDGFAGLVKICERQLAYANPSQEVMDIITRKLDEVGEDWGPIVQKIHTKGENCENDVKRLYSAFRIRQPWKWGGFENKGMKREYCTTAEEQKRVCDSLRTVKKCYKLDVSKYIKPIS